MATPDDGQWLLASKDYANNRFSGLSEINSSNVRNLQLAWRFSTAVLRGHEGAPLVVGGTMYFVTAYPDLLYALNLKNGGAKKWEYKPKPSSASQGVPCCEVVNRGAVYRDGKIIYNTLDAHMVAVDAATGKEVWKTKPCDINRGETITMAPMVVKGKALAVNALQTIFRLAASTLVIQPRTPNSPPLFPKVLVRPERNGYIYVMDPQTGGVLSADPYIHTTVSKSFDIKTGKVIEDSSKATGFGRTARNICPAAPGGKDWQPTSWSPRTRLLCIPHNLLCMDYEGVEANYIAGAPYVGASVKMYAGPDANRGEFSAWDPMQKKKVWSLKEKFPAWSGALATASDVVFYGAMDRWFKALDARTGELLRQFRTGSGIIGQRISAGNRRRDEKFARQYDKGGTIYVFSLP